MASRLLRRIRDGARARGLSLSTGDRYAGWARSDVRFHGLRHPSELAEPEVQAFLTHLAVDRDVAKSTQIQALSAPMGG